MHHGGRGEAEDGDVGSVGGHAHGPGQAPPGAGPGAAHGAVYLAGALAREHHAHGLEQDHQVQQQRVVLDVVEVVLQLLLRVLDRRAVLVAHLRPAGDAGLDAVAHGVEGDLAASAARRSTAARAAGRPGSCRP